MSTLKIFDVEHGSCALFTASTGSRLLVDCGKNGETGWTPAVELKAAGATMLDQLAITNYDEDHADGLPELRAEFYIHSLWRSVNVSPDDICELKSADGMGRGIKELVNMSQSYTADCEPVDFGNLKTSMFYNGRRDFDDENNLSAIIVLEIEGIKFIFPGDMERAGFDKILSRNEVRAAVQNAAVLVAPHHGRECSVHPEFLELVRPFWTVISDRGYMYDTQKTVPTYHHYSRGAEFRGKLRSVLTTRKDGTIEFWFDGSSWGAH